MMDVGGLSPSTPPELLHHAEFSLDRSTFETLLPQSRNVDGASEPVFRGAADYQEVVFRATLEAGTPGGGNPDSPTTRIDPNDQSARYPGVGSLQIASIRGSTVICSGTVVGRRQVLTAAHCFDIDGDGNADNPTHADSRFFLNDGGSPSAELAIDHVMFHPDFDGFQSSGASDDIALVTLATDVPKGTVFYGLRDSELSPGEVIEIVGYGVSGRGDIPGNEVFPDVTVKRFGKNTVDLFVLDDEGTGANEIFLYDFDGPFGPGLLGDVTLGNTVETVARHGDSGGPALIEEHGELLIVGVNTFDFAIVGVTAPSGEFGTVGGGSVIGQRELKWIRGEIERFEAGSISIGTSDPPTKSGFGLRRSTRFDSGNPETTPVTLESVASRRRRASQPSIERPMQLIVDQ